MRDFAALSTAGRVKTTAAAGLYNVVRQVFGSIGISLTATRLTRGENICRTVLVGNLNIFNPKMNTRLDTLNGAFLHQGADLSTARSGALRLLDSELMRQAGMLSYNHVFLLVAYLFVIAVPLVFLLKHAGGGAAGDIVID